MNQKILFPKAIPLKIESPDDLREIQALGGQPYYVDSELRCWYIPPNTNVMPFSRWWKPEFEDKVRKQIDQTSTAAVANLQDQSLTSPFNESLSLTQVLSKIKVAVKQALPAMIWVRFEIVNISGHSKTNKEGHVYFEVTEKSESGKDLAKAKATLWSNNRRELLNFENKTGTQVSSGMKILAMVEVVYSEIFGLSLTVKKIDPLYTIGESELILRQIRSKLIEDGLYKNNKSLTPPAHFQRVAVLAPKDAAGLGDFNSVANSLIESNICEFDFYHASFQGKKMEAEITEAIKLISEKHMERQYDAIAIIRGGGDKGGLYELNKYSIAREICQMTIPVIVGIGHERDSTIIDEIACIRCATPSLVISHIQQLIISNANHAIKIHDAFCSTIEIMAKAAADNNHRNSLLINQQADLTIKFAERLVNSKNTEMKLNLDLLSSSTARSVKAVESAIFIELNNISNQVNTAHEKNINFICSYELTSKINQQITLKSSLVKQQATGIIDKTLSFQKNKEMTAFNAADSLMLKTKHNYERCFLNVMANNPFAILDRGYALCFNENGNVINSKLKATNQNNFNVRFKDGSVGVRVVNEK